MSRSSSRVPVRAPGGFVVAAAGMLLLAAAPARAQSPADTALYTVNNSTTLSVVTNRATGTTAAIGTLAFATSALARDPVTRRIYYLATNAATPVGRVAYYDPKTGTNTIINNVGSGGDNLVKMTFNAGLIYALGDVAHGSILYTIDPVTGVYTSLGAVRIAVTNELFPDNGDLAFDAFGTLYANANRPAGAAGTSLYTINLNTRVATVVGTLNGANTQAALTFAAGVLYSGGGGGQWYTVNTATGAGTLINNNAYTWYDFATGPPVADLQMTKTATAGFTAGAAATYTLTARNNGPYPATGTITVTDTLPAGLTYTSGTGTGWACSATPGVVIVTCTRAGPVASGTTLPAIAIVVGITNAVAPSITNTAWVWSSTMGDQNESNNDGSVTSAVTVRSVSTTPDGTTISQLPSNATQYTQVFTVRNTGSMADSYSLAATVAPAGVVTIVSVNGVAGTAGNTGALASLAQTNVTVVYTVAAGAATGASAKLTLTATSTTLGTTKDAGDLTVTVIRAGITMSKQLYRDDQSTLVTGPTGVTPGEYVQYKVTVTSSGVAGAAAVSVTDAVPAAVTYVTATGDAPGWTVANAAGTVTASLAGTLATGGSRFFWIRVRVK